MIVPAMDRTYTSYTITMRENVTDLPLKSGKLSSSFRRIDKGSKLIRAGVVLRVRLFVRPRNEPPI